MCHFVKGKGIYFGAFIIRLQADFQSSLIGAIILPVILEADSAVITQSHKIINQNKSKIIIHTAQSHVENN